MNNLSEEKIIKKTETAVILEFSILGSSDYFDGHFPDFPILPAVAQVNIIMQCVSRFFGNNIGLSEIKRSKFINIIRPDTALVLYLEKKENNLLFKIASPDEETMFSTGTLILSEVL